MRRSDREITDRTVIDEIIRSCSICHLGLAVEGEPYVVPISFGYDGHSVFFHTAASGKKIDMMAVNPRVCVQFENKVALVTDTDQPCAWSFSFESAIGFGIVVELVDPVSKADGLNRVMRQYSDRDWAFDDSSLGATRVWRVDLETVTGKRSEQKG